MIDNHGEWAKIDGHQWFGSHLLKNCSKTSFSKRLMFILSEDFWIKILIDLTLNFRILKFSFYYSFQTRFPFMRQSNKKGNARHQQAPKTPQQAFKYPLLTDSSYFFFHKKKTNQNQFYV
jgi:hypothetical protein